MKNVTGTPIIVNLGYSEIRLPKEKELICGSQIQIKQTNKQNPQLHTNMTYAFHACIC